MNKATFTKNELVAEILNHTGNLSYNNDTDSYNHSYNRKELNILSNEELIQIYKDFTSDEELQVTVGG